MPHVICLLLNSNVYTLLYNHASSATSITQSQPTPFYPTTTATTSAVVKPSLDSRAQPVATERAVPLTSTPDSSLVVGM